MQPKIGITTWLRPLPTYLGQETALYTLGQEYVERVQAAGGVPILLLLACNGIAKKCQPGARSAFSHTW